MALFEVGGMFPPTQKDVERLAKYQDMQKFFEGKQDEIYRRASELLKDSAYKSQMEELYLNCNLADVIASKPSELLLSQSPIIESGEGADSEEQKALSRIVEENDIRQLIFNITVGAAIRGDGFLKDYFNYRMDYSELTKMGLPIPKTATREAVIESVNPSYVFPELARGSMTEFKAVNIAYVEWYNEKKRSFNLFRDKGTGLFTREVEVPYLYVERHLPGYVIYERYQLSQDYVADVNGIGVPVFRIEKQVPVDGDNLTKRVETGADRPLVFHFAYKQTDIDWSGVGAIEKIAHMLVAIADRLTSIDFILHKHSDPILTGPELEGMGDLVRLNGAYVTRSENDPELKYITWDGKLDHSFKELDLLLSTVFLQSQLPTWLFGSSITSATEGGGGTSHTDSTALKLRYAPVSALLDRLNSNLTKCLGDALYYAQVLENFANTDENGVAIEGFVTYEPKYPTIKLSNGIPANDQEITDIIVLRYQAKLIDRLTALKELDRVGDEYAQEMLKRIEAEEIKQQEVVQATLPTVTTPKEGE